ncbi:hypothetical protein AX15_007387 [Amanita polypyramis BW_CC]|nr:hypothetical protein AX15_007387 [Amanita polypyramis BW_CC]
MPTKAQAMITILCLSLSAVSFPGISHQLPIVRVPGVIFFIGKHFGTGVILSTAFCHLLGDAFKSLNKPIVKEHYNKIAKWTAPMILSSLLTMFLVGYISTTYADYLQGNSTAPPLPIKTPNPSHPASKCNNRTALADNPFVPNGQPRSPDLDSRLCVKCCFTIDSCTCNGQGRQQAFCYNGEVVGRGGGHIEQKDTQEVKGGNKRQVVGILVLQLGIMIHSLVVGLTLSIAQGSDFASLLVAICFHQVFEGLSLGIRIDALLPSTASSLSACKSPPQVSPLLPESTSLILSQCSTPSYASTRHCARKSVVAQTCYSRRTCFSRINWMKIVLSILFAVTTPIGMIVGLYAFPHGGGHGGPGQQALVFLTQGIMSAISAGMLIYVGTVEMIAGDFVFGDVTGGHSHHASGRGHSHVQVGDVDFHESNSRSHQRSDGLFESESDACTSTPSPRDFDRELRDDGPPDGHRESRSTVGQKAVAVASLFAGAVVMNVTSLFE